LTAKGVTFLQEPADRPYGIEAVMRDNSGNWLVLVEPRPVTPASPAEPLRAVSAAGRAAA